MLRFVLVSLLAILSSSVCAQTDTTTEPIETDRVHETAGFTMHLAGEYTPWVPENSNAVLYSVNYYRQLPDSSIHPDDQQIAFLRLTQTVSPMAELGTIRKLREANLTDAQTSIESLNANDNVHEPVECTRTIAGQQRTGTLITITQPQGTWNVECYAFEHDGKGIGVILKTVVPNADAQPDAINADEQLADALLEKLEIHTLTQNDVYPYKLSGYPIYLPISSRVDNAQQLDENTIQMQISLPEGQLQILAINIPEIYDIVASERDIRTNHRTTIQTESQNNQLKLHWESPTHLPVGPDRDNLEDADAYLFEVNDNVVFSNVFTYTHGRLLIFANFLAVADNAQQLGARIQQYFDHAVAPLRATDRARWETYQLAANTIELSPKYRVWNIEHDEKYDTAIIAPSNYAIADLVLDSAVQGSAITFVRFYEPDSDIDLESAHRAICEEFKYRMRAADTPTEPFNDACEPGSTHLADGADVASFKSVFAPVIDPEKDTKKDLIHNQIAITSHWLPRDKEQPKVVIATISNELLHANADAISRVVMDRLTPDPIAGTIDVGFANLVSDPMTIQGITSNTDDAERALWIGDDEVVIYTYGPDPSFKVLSQRLLADKYLSPMWSSIANQDERDRYPKQSEGLTQTIIADHPALVFQTHLDAVGPRLIPMRVRLYGFLHGDQYTVFTIKQYDNFDDARLDEVAQMFIPKK